MLLMMILMMMLYAIVGNTILGNTVLGNRVIRMGVQYEHKNCNTATLILPVVLRLVSLSNDSHFDENLFHQLDIGTVYSGLRRRVIIAFLPPGRYLFCLPWVCKMWRRYRGTPAQYLYEDSGKDYKRRQWERLPCHKQKRYNQMGKNKNEGGRGVQWFYWLGGSQGWVDYFQFL